MGFTPIDNSEIASPSSAGFTPISEEEILPSLLKNPIDALTSKDWWTTRPSGEKISAGQAVAGPLLSSLDMMTYGQGDEIVSAGSSVLDYLTGKKSSYSDNLNQTRAIQSSFKEADPVASTALEIASSLKNPLLMASKVGQTAGYLPKVAQAAKEAAAGGLAFGFSEGEGGFSNRVQNAIKSGSISALLGGGITGLTQGASNLANSYSNKLANASQETLEKGLGVQYGERAKGLNKVNLYVDEAGNTVPFDQLDDAVGIQSPIQQQIKTLEDSGILTNAPNDVQSLKLHVTKEGSKLGKTIPQLVKQADEVLGETQIMPDFKETEKFLSGYRASTKNNLAKQFDSIIEDYKTMEGGGLKKLTKFVDQLQKETNFDQATPKEITQLKRMISYDMRKASEKQFDTALPELSGQFAKVNEIVAATKSIGKTLNKPLARKTPEIGDYITGGSLPMTVLTGALSAPLGFTPAATISGARLLKNAVKQYMEATRPISTSAAYKSLSGKSAEAAKSIAKITGKSLIGALSSKDPVSAAIKEAEKVVTKKALEAPQVVEVKRTPQPDAKIKAIEKKIDSDPIDATIYEMESGRNPLAKNPESTASGAFQLLKKTASNLGIKDVFDIEQNYNGYLKLKEEAKPLVKGGDPEDFYAVHYLGAPTYKRWRAGKELTQAQSAQVEYLTKKLLPKFRRIYAQKIKNKSGMVEA
jgi:hypothetical protein